MDELDLLEVRIDADIGPFEHKLLDAGRLGDKFAANLTSAFGKAFIQGQKLDDVFKSLFSSLSNSAFSNALKPLETELNGVFSNLLSSVSSMGAPSGSFSPLPNIQNRAASRHQGEQKTSFGGAQQPTIVFNVQTPDAESFMRSEAQVNAMIARAAKSGGRNA